MSLSSHILDTSVGKPAAGIAVVLYEGSNENWSEIFRGSSNEDGRIPALSSEVKAKEGTYKIRFETGDYFTKKNIKTFYPYVDIIFEIKDNEHYHVPLLLNPFGYSTYRGS